MNVTPIDRQWHHRRAIDAAEIWAQEEPSDAAVWDVCSYLRSNPERCMECPEWEGDPENLVTRGCRAMAAEVCRIAAAGLERSKQNRPS